VIFVAHGYVNGAALFFISIAAAQRVRQTTCLKSCPRILDAPIFMTVLVLLGSAGGGRSWGFRWTLVHGTREDGTKGISDDSSHLWAWNRESPRRSYFFEIRSEFCEHATRAHFGFKMVRRNDEVYCVVVRFHRCGQAKCTFQL
jgi:hypothetical protein